jgi:cadmium resistance transport/sequestration family protein
MNWIVTAMLTGAVTFTATNVDDIFILMLFFSQTNSSFRRRHIVAGQYLGFAVLVAISLLGFFGSLIVPRAWIGLLGLLPIILGINKFLQRNKNSEPVTPRLLDTPGSKTSVFSGLLSRQTYTVAAVTFANGGDNIGIYTPLFASSDPVQLGILLSVFFLLVGVWCYAGFSLTRHPLIVAVLARYGHLLVPFVLVGLGIYILVESGTFSLLRH